MEIQRANWFGRRCVLLLARGATGVEPRLRARLLRRRKWRHSIGRRPRHGPAGLGRRHEGNARDRFRVRVANADHQGKSEEKSSANLKQVCNNYATHVDKLIKESLNVIVKHPTNLFSLNALKTKLSWSSPSEDFVTGTRLPIISTQRRFDSNTSTSRLIATSLKCSCKMVPYCIGYTKSA